MKTHVAMDTWCHVASLGSLLVSAYHFFEFFVEYHDRSHSTPLYGGAALFLFLIFIAQGAALLFLVGIPAGCIYLSGKRPFSLRGGILFGAACVASTGEFFWLCSIPTMGGC